MNPKRILFVTNRVPYPLSDGGNLAMDATLKGYLNAGYSVYLLSMNTSRHPVSDEVWDALYPGLAGKSKVEVDNRIRPIPLFWNWLFSSRPNHVMRFEDVRFRRRLVEVVDQFSPDFIHIESVYLSSYVPLLRSKTSAKLILRLHNLEYQIWDRLYHRENRWMFRAYLGSLSRRIRQYERESWANYDLLLPITAEDAKVLAREVPQVPRITWPFGWDHFPGLSFDSKRPLRKVYHLGAMDWIPNQEGIEWFLREVWPLIHARYPDFRFQFGGRNMPASFQTPREDGSEAVAEVPSALDFLSSQDILVVPLLSGGGIRVKILEAMAARKLVVTTSWGIEGIDAVAGRHYFLADTAMDFLEVFGRVVKEPEKAVEMIEQAHLWVNQHYASSRLMAPVKRFLDQW